MQHLRDFIENESGATAIEYGLIAALIAVAAIGTLTSLGDEITAVFSTVETKLKEANTP